MDYLAYPKQIGFEGMQAMMQITGSEKSPGRAAGAFAH
jgi:hypothetical protein